jgi:hypothetical protein
VIEAVRQWGDEAAKVARSSPWPLADGELPELMLAVHRTQQIMGALLVQMTREAAAQGLPATHGHRTMAGWLRSLLRIDPQPARELAEMAIALHRRPAVEQALIDGTIDLRQAAVIAAAVAAIPDLLTDADALTASELDPVPSSPAPLLAPAAITDQAEAKLIEFAGQFPAYQLRRLGDRILTHVAPEVAERADEMALRRAEARAHSKRHFALSLPIGGLVRVSGLLGVEDAAVVSAALHPLARPSADTEDDRSFPQRRADALVDVCRLALRTRQLPEDGGEPPQLAVTVRFDPLAARLATGVLPDGERVSSATARRFACDARILPVLLGSSGQVLDLGRSRRLATGPLRRALAVRDGGCAFPGCDRPSRWCDAHHLRAWHDGGATDLDNLVLLCRHHHRLLHDPSGGWRAATLGRPPATHAPEHVPPTDVIPADARP